MNKIAIINHDKTECGVYHHGWAAHQILSESTTYEYEYVCVSDGQDFKSWIEKNYKQFSAFIFNWHPATLWWLTDDLLKQIPKPKFILTGHDTVSDFANANYHFICDPTVPVGETKGGVSRPVFLFDDVQYSPPSGDVIKIGSFGFGQKQKQFPKIIQKVNAEFADPVQVNIHMPYGDFVDQSGKLAKSIEDECHAVAALNVNVNITHDYIANYHDLSAWLNQNDINVFNYMEQPGRGCSSSIDAAISSQKPFACNSNNMYRHVRDNKDILLEHNTLADIIARGIAPSKAFAAKWSHAQFIEDHETIIKKYVKV